MPDLRTTPSDALRARLDDPKVAASLDLILDNADTLALGLVALDGLLRRADTISDNIEAGLKDVKSVAESFSYLAAPTRRLTEEAPRIADAAEALLESGMLSREVVNLLGRLADAMVEGAERARTRGTTVNGLLPALRALRDPEVARGLGFVVEVSRSLGKAL
ncbi:MAG TPA: DUF1641 domain-containing protein [Kineosporiaceae bacterium]